MHNILQYAIKSLNQIFRSGLAFLETPIILIQRSKRVISFIVLCTSLFLVGSCNERVELFDFSNKPENFKSLSQGDLVRYGYAVQTAMIQEIGTIKNFRTQDIKLALSLPDLDRQDGDSRIWQYRTDSCIMDIFWKKNTKQSEAVHVEFRTRRFITDDIENAISTWKCVQTIIQERHEGIEAGFEQSYADNTQAVLSLKAHKS